MTDTPEDTNDIRIANGKKAFPLVYSEQGRYFYHWNHKCKLTIWAELDKIGLPIRHPATRLLESPYPLRFYGPYYIHDNRAMFAVRIDKKE